MANTYNPLIPKKAIKAIEKFSADLKAFAEETGETYPTLYEDAFTTFEVRNLVFTYDGTLCYQDEEGRDQIESYIIEEEDEETGKTYEVWDEYEWEMGLRYWKAGLRRAKRYWAMETETLDKIQDGEIEDTENEED